MVLAPYVASRLALAASVTAGADLLAPYLNLTYTSSVPITRDWPT